MRKMKNSGIQWMGDIPENWKIIRMKSCISDRNSGAWGNEPTGTNDTVCLRIADFDYSAFKFKDTDISNLTKRSYDKDTVKKLKLNKGDILIEKSGGGEKTPVGRTVVFDKNYIALFANFMDRLICAEFIYPMFMQYIFVTFYRNGYTKNYIKQTTGIQNLDITSMLSQEQIAICDINEQQKIADFLDKKCGEIDNIITRTKATIEEYKKLKQSVITQAVTKGIRKNRPMKDSGIQWIGDIPQEWKTIKLKYVVSYNDDILDENTNKNFTFDYIDIGSVEYGKGIVKCERMTYRNAPSRARRIVKKDDIILSTVRTYLKAIATISEFDVPQIVSTGFIVLRAIENKILPRFLNFAVLSTAFISMIECKSVGISYPAINSSEVVNLFLPVPNINEQQRIADFLDEKCSEIDKLIRKKEQLLDELENYKKSLIYEYVTGKKEVLS